MGRGQLANATSLRVGDELVYVVRAWSDDSTYDETFPQRMQLLRPEGVVHPTCACRIRSTASPLAASTPLPVPERLRQIETSFGQNSLSRQNIQVCPQVRFRRGANVFT